MNIVVNDSNGGQMTYNIEAFQKEVVSFGRQTDNDIVLNYEFVSRVHGAIYQEGQSYYVEDLDSTNGIYVNGNRVKRARIQNGDRVVIARSQNDRNYVQLSVVEEVMVQQPVYGQPQYAQPVYGQQYGYMQPQQPMAWYKFVIYFQLFAAALFSILIAILCISEVIDLNQQDEMQYLEWADGLLGSNYSDSITSILIQFIVTGVFALLMMVACIWVRCQLAGFKAKAPERYYTLNYGMAVLICLYNAIYIQIAGIEKNTEEWLMSGGDSYVNGQIFGAIGMVVGICFIVTAVYVTLNKSYFNKRKHLFTR